jgi:hypothetical protein
MVKSYWVLLFCVGCRFDSRLSADVLVTDCENAGCPAPLVCRTARFTAGVRDSVCSSKDDTFAVSISAVTPFNASQARPIAAPGAIAEVQVVLGGHGDGVSGLVWGVGQRSGERIEFAPSGEGRFVFMVPANHLAETYSLAGRFSKAREQQHLTIPNQFEMIEIDPNMPSVMGPPLIRILPPPAPASFPEARDPQVPRPKAMLASTVTVEFNTSKDVQVELATLEAAGTAGRFDFVRSPASSSKRLIFETAPGGVPPLPDGDYRLTATLTSRAGASSQFFIGMMSIDQTPPVASGVKLEISPYGNRGQRVPTLDVQLEAPLGVYEDGTDVFVLDGQGTLAALRTPNRMAIKRFILLARRVMVVSIDPAGNISNEEQPEVMRWTFQDATTGANIISVSDQDSLTTNQLAVPLELVPTTKAFGLTATTTNAVTFDWVSGALVGAHSSSGVTTPAQGAFLSFADDTTVQLYRVGSTLDGPEAFARLAFDAARNLVIAIESGNSDTWAFERREGAVLPPTKLDTASPSGPITYSPPHRAVVAVSDGGTVALQLSGWTPVGPGAPCTSLEFWSGRGALVCTGSDGQVWEQARGKWAPTLGPSPAAASTAQYLRETRHDGVLHLFAGRSHWTFDAGWVAGPDLSRPVDVAPIYDFNAQTLVTVSSQAGSLGRTEVLTGNSEVRVGRLPQRFSSPTFLRSSDRVYAVSDGGLVSWNTRTGWATCGTPARFVARHGDSLLIRPAPAGIQIRRPASNTDPCQLTTLGAFPDIEPAVGAAFVGSDTTALTFGAKLPMSNNYPVYVGRPDAGWSLVSTPNGPLAVPLASRIFDLGRDQFLVDSNIVSALDGGVTSMVSAFEGASGVTEGEAGVATGLCGELLCTADGGKTSFTSSAGLRTVEGALFYSPTRRQYLLMDTANPAFSPVWFNERPKRSSLRLLSVDTGLSLLGYVTSKCQVSFGSKNQGVLGWARAEGRWTAASLGTDAFETSDPSVCLNSTSGYRAAIATESGVTAPMSLSITLRPRDAL